MSRKRNIITSLSAEDIYTIKNSKGEVANDILKDLMSSTTDDDVKRVCDNIIDDKPIKLNELRQKDMDIIMLICKYIRKYRPDLDPTNKVSIKDTVEKFINE